MSSVKMISQIWNFKEKNFGLTLLVPDVLYRNKEPHLQGQNTSRFPQIWRKIQGFIGKFLKMPDDEQKKSQLNIYKYIFQSRVILCGEGNFSNDKGWVREFLKVGEQYKHISK